ncbi:hypothetical protein B0J13DRAFT_635634, partial [Dactylonectria estremocensis]
LPNPNPQNANTTHEASKHTTASTPSWHNFRKATNMSDQTRRRATRLNPDTPSQASPTSPQKDGQNLRQSKRLNPESMPRTPGVVEGKLRRSARLSSGGNSKLDFQLRNHPSRTGSRPAIKSRLGVNQSRNPPSQRGSRLAIRSDSTSLKNQLSHENLPEIRDPKNFFQPPNHPYIDMSTLPRSPILAEDQEPARYPHYFGGAGVETPKSKTEDMFPPLHTPPPFPFASRYTFEERSHLRQDSTWVYENDAPINAFGISPVQQATKTKDGGKSTQDWLHRPPTEFSGS